MKHTLLFVIGVLLATGLQMSCKTSDPECKSCGLQAPVKEGSIVVGESSYETKVWKQQNYDYQFAYATTKADPAKILDRIPAIALESNVEVAAVIFYTNKYADGLITDAQSIQDENTQAIGVYFIKENKLRFRFYLKENNAYRIIPELNAEVKAMSSNDLFDIYKIYFSENKEGAAIAITNEDVLFKTTYSKSHTLGYNISYLSRKALGSSAWRQTTGGPDCDAPCSGGHNCQNGLHGWSCDYTDEEENDGDQANVHLINGTPRNEVDSAYDIGLHYRLRDSFLMHYAIGQKYVDYYYGMTSTAYLSSDIVNNTLPFLKKINNIVYEWLVNNNTSQVLLTDDLATEADALLDLYMAAAPNPTEAAYFTDIKTDVAHFKGKTIAEILAEIQ